MSDSLKSPESISGIFHKEDGKRQFLPTTEQRLQDLESNLLEQHGTGLIDFVRVRLEDGGFVRQLATELGITNTLLEKVCDLAGVPRPTKADVTRMRWENGSLSREDASARTRAMMEDEGFRAKALDALSVAREKQRTDPDHAERTRQRNFKNWQDPEYAARMSANMQGQWQDPEFASLVSETSRDTMSRLLQDPDFKAKQAAGAGDAARKRWADPEQRAEMIRKISEANQRRMADPEIASRVIQMSREVAIKQWEDPEFVEMMATKGRERWNDESWRLQTTEAMREAARRPERVEAQRLITTQRWQDPEYREKMKTLLKPPTIYGARADLDFVALSTWEANFARVLKYVGRDFLAHEQLTLTVPEEFRNKIASETTTFDVDFLTITPRGNIVLYEIMAHPLEDPVGWAKLEIASQQYGGLDIRPVLPRFYETLEDSFKDKVNSDTRFKGWETGDDNLRTNPNKFAPSE